MRPLIRSLLVLLSSLNCWASADILVIVNPESPISESSKQFISDLYLGRVRAARDSERLVVLDQPRNSELRSRFFWQLNGMNLRNINAYWARLEFSGACQPPIAQTDSLAVVNAVRNNRLAVGYVEAATLPDGVKTILVLKE